MEEREGGFTLIELLVVIIIIGILAAIAIPVFLNQRKKGYEASMKSDLRTVANEMETYFTDQQTYVGAVSGNLIGSGQTVGSDTVTLSNGNTVAVVSGKVGDNGFCLQATSSKTTKTWFYDSLNGGLTTACSASGY
jgi:prepilin-type N-terminal cleavage/methylation domain-containing protein